MERTCLDVVPGLAAAGDLGQKEGVEEGEYNGKHNIIYHLIGLRKGCGKISGGRWRFGDWVLGLGIS